MIKNTIHIAKAALLANLFNKKTPVNIMWRITDRCNFDCSYCEVKKNNHAELSTGQILDLVDQMAERGTQRIGFVGGEVFLRTDLEQIVDHVKRKGIYATIVSNGSLVGDNMDIVKKIDCLVLSFDGKKKNHEKGRAKGSYDKLIQAFELCKKERIKLITITVLNRYNLNDIGFVLSMAKRYGFCCNFHLLQGVDCSYPSNNQYRKALDQLITKKKQGAPILSSLRTLKFLRRWGDYKKFVASQKPGAPRCWAGKLVFNIDTDGSVAICDIYSRALKNNPNVIDLGFERAIEKVKNPNCRACTCAQYLDYNYMFSFSFDVIHDWLRFVFKKNML